MHPRSIILACLLLSSNVVVAQKLEPPPEWAFPVNPPGLKPVPDDGTILRVPGSSVAMTLTQTRDRYLPPVWHAGDHPPLPPVVARGRKPEVWACALCHRADGPGGPENANVAGLSRAYFVQQMRDYRSGARGTSVPGRNTQNMIDISKHVTDEEIEAAAEYFSALKPKRTLTVIETDMVPKTHITSNHYVLLKTTNAKEPLGRRIIEVPEEMDHFSIRDSRARFIVYVPVGSVESGRKLASTGAGKTMACAACHGTDLKGIGNVPGIAGRFASHTARQLYDYKSGARNGPESSPMKLVVEKLTNEDILLLSAYAASLEP